MTSWFIVDCEATDATPMTGVLTEFGVVEMASLKSFYGKLYDSKPSAENPARPVITGVGYDQRAVINELAEYLYGFTEPYVFVSDNPAFDFMWIACLHDQHGYENPFGYSGRRIGDFAAGLAKKWAQTSRWKRLRKTKHTHNPVDDAMGNAEALRQLLGIDEADVVVTINPNPPTL